MMKVMSHTSTTRISSKFEKYCVCTFEDSDNIPDSTRSLRDSTTR